MSILLDAVIRKKQTSGNLPDPAMAPRPYPILKGKNLLSSRALFALVISITGGALCAYSLNSLLSETSTSKLMTSSQVINGDQQSNSDIIKVIPSEKMAIYTDHLKEELNTSNSVKSDMEIRYIGDASLPEIQNAPNRSPVNLPSNTIQQPLKTIKSEPSSEKNNSQKKQVNHNKSVEQKVVSNSGEQKNTIEKTSQDQPIVLGAVNHLTKEQLAIIEKEAAIKPKPLPVETSKTEGSQKEDDLVAALQAALKDVEYERAITKSIGESDIPPIDVNIKDDLPKVEQLNNNFKRKIPAFHVLAHVYANSPERRWLNVDGEELQEGDMIHGALKIVEIRPRDIVLEIEGIKFKIPAF